MMNLLPQKEQDRLHHEHHLRLSVVALLALLTVLFVANMILVPSVVLSSVRLSITQEQKESMENSEIGQKRRDLSATAREANAKIGFLKESDSARSVSSMTEALISSRGENVTLSTILYQKKAANEESEEQASVNIQVRGMAETREDLIMFRDNLKENEAFVEVIFPVSNLVSDENIEFTMELTVKSPEQEAASNPEDNSEA